ncbi:N-acetylglucosamine kinase [Cellvibrio sp. pealriver]|uniref:N-acetylglucosamine kinase n=1 Tax=Cellvibrio sp. pealriver TaxID=1622269 RepID=UPI00066FEFC1|nr:BadF/BadG/BcrA/BcrD ATPase family protein [Cellvibrio sp. pealriver]
MAKMPLGEQPLFIGIDGGGTKCRASIMTADLQVLGTGVGGPANPFQGVQQAKDSIRTAAELALIDAGLPPSAMSELIAGAGLAGVNVPSLYDVMSAWEHPFKEMHLTTDLHIACLGAHNRDEGAVMICGTGSCGYSFVNNESLFIGGHGFPIGDKGSGAWMGLEAIQAILLAYDDLGPQTKLSESIGEFLQASGVMIVDRMFGAKQGDYAKFAIFVVDAADAGDAVAIGIAKEGAAYMSGIARKLWATNPGRMSIIGGLAPRLIPWMEKDMAEKLSPALYQPEFGAVYFAKQRFKYINNNQSVLTTAN